MGECDRERNGCPDYLPKGGPDFSLKQIPEQVTRISMSINGDKQVEQIPFHFIIRNRKMISSSNDLKLNDQISLKLEFTENVSPFKFEWFIQNQTSYKNNNYTNGSTNS